MGREIVRCRRRSVDDEFADASPLWTTTPLTVGLRQIRRPQTCPKPALKVHPVGWGRTHSRAQQGPCGKNQV
jgi:hypothetical protein